MTSQRIPDRQKVFMRRLARNLAACRYKGIVPGDLHEALDGCRYGSRRPLQQNLYGIKIAAGTA